MEDINIYKNVFMIHRTRKIASTLKMCYMMTKVTDRTEVHWRQ